MLKETQRVTLTGKRDKAHVFCLVIQGCFHYSLIWLDVLDTIKIITTLNNFCKKLNKQKPQLNKIERPKEGDLTPWEDNRVQQEKDCFLGNNSTSETTWTHYLM